MISSVGAQSAAPLLAFPRRFRPPGCGLALHGEAKHRAAGGGDCLRRAGSGPSRWVGRRGRGYRALSWGNELRLGDPLTGRSVHERRAGRGPLELDRLAPRWGMGRPGSGESVGGPRAIRRRTPARRRSDLCRHYGHGRRADRGGARNGGAALVLRYLGWRLRGRTLYRVDFGRAARDGAPHARAPVVAARRGRDIADRAAERRADTLSRRLVHGRKRGRDIRSRSGGRIPLDRGAPLVHVRLDRGGQRLPAAVPEATGAPGARGPGPARRGPPWGPSPRGHL